MKQRKTYIMIALTYFFIKISILKTYSADATASSGTNMEILNTKIDSAVIWLNLIMTSGSFILAISGICLAIFGYINLHRADKIVDKRIKSTIEKLKNEFSLEFNKIQESTQKMIAGYNNQQIGNIDTAIELYKSAIEIYPETFNAYTSLGYAYLEKNNPVEALLAFNKAAELYPDKVASFNDLARIHAMLNNKIGCIQNIEEMLKLDPTSKTFLLNDPIILNVLTESEIDAI